METSDFKGSSASASLDKCLFTMEKLGFMASIFMSCSRILFLRGPPILSGTLSFVPKALFGGGFTAGA